MTELLHLLPDEVRDSDDLFEAGLDSIRLLTLLERWRDAGAEVGFVDLAARPTLSDWIELLAPVTDLPGTPPLTNAA
ncbi:aryl carrier-like protein [Actinophytocola oryzae]|uniref:Aryl carrier-like protein n=1 Tax=Actinophytocola oryzae TaxID=502181 RepID=A0A4R7VUH6_9PSEU|nr:aryl carrier-like protein [Actinophytocola oryzae]